MALAKTIRPTSVAAIARPRLFNLLDRLQRRPVTWVWAPLGAGKTVLIASNLASRKLNHLCFQVDDGDGDLSSFFYFLGLAAPKRRRPMPLLTPEFRQNVGIFTRNFFRELYSRLKTPFTLVFANYQEVLIESDLNTTMSLGLAGLPDGGRLIFISRNEPPSFAKLRADQAVELLDYSEIRFIESEAAGLIQKLSRCSTWRVRGNCVLWSRETDTGDWIDGDNQFGKETLMNQILRIVAMMVVLNGVAVVLAGSALATDGQLEVCD